MKKMIIQAQEDTVAAVDTLTRSYSTKWDGSGSLDQSSAFMQMFASNDLIFIVLAVSLIIWFVLLYFIIRVDRKVGRMEEQLEQKSISE